MGELWTKKESLVLIYFASRGVRAEALPKIIKTKCNTTRSLASVQHRIRYVRSRERAKGRPDIWHATTGWLPERVDRWVADVGQFMPEAGRLITVGIEEIAIIADVCRHLLPTGIQVSDVDL